MASPSGSSHSSGSEDQPLVDFAVLDDPLYDEEAAGGSVAGTGAPRVKRARKMANRARLSARPRMTRNMSVTMGAGALIFAVLVLLVVFLHHGTGGAAGGPAPHVPAGGNGRSVRFVAPGSPVGDDAVALGRAAYAEVLRGAVADRLAVDGGLGVSLGEHALGRAGLFAASDEKRAADLAAALTDDSVAMVIVAGGVGGPAAGGCMRTAAAMNFPRVLHRARRPLMGGGDATVLLNAAFELGGMATFYGPQAGGPGANWSDATVAGVRSVIVLGETPVLGNDAPGAQPATTVVAGVARGAAVGGDLSAVASMVGTPYLPAPAAMAGRVLFLDAADVSAADVDRMLTRLGASGHLGAAAGVVFGGCARCTASADGVGWEAVVDERLAALSRAPSFRGAMFGGGAPHQYVVPIGIPVEIDAAAGTVRVLEPAVTTASI